MAQLVPVIVDFTAKLFAGTAFGGGVAGGVAQALAITAVSAGVSKLLQKDFEFDQGLGNRDVTVRGGTEYVKLVYGQVMVGGVLRYSGVVGSDSQYLWRSDILAGHEIEDIVAVKIGGDYIQASDITWASNLVSGGTYADYVKLYKLLGTTTQAVNSALDSAFTDITTSHTAKGRALLEARLEWVEASNSIWEQIGAPQNLAGQVKGQPNIYDPRLDSSPGNDPGNASYQAYSTNPVLQIAHYLTDQKYGLGNRITTDDVNWQWIEDEAEYSDRRTPDPDGGNGAVRFSSNVQLSTGETYRENLMKLLSACDGLTVCKRNGKWIVRTGRFGYGSNLCANPEFETNLTGWADGNGAGSGTRNASLQMLALVNGTGGFQTKVYGFSVTAGNVYCCRAVVKADSEVTAADNYGIAATYNSDGQTDKLASQTKTNYDSELRIQFKATSTGTCYLSLYINSVTSGKTAEFDDVEIYLVTDITIDNDWLVDDWQRVPDQGGESRYNAVDSIYVSQSEGYKAVEAFRVASNDYLSRDNGELLIDEINLPCTITEYEAQRLAFRHLNKSDYNKVFRLPCNYKGLDVALYDVVNLNIPSLSSTEVTARVEEIAFYDMQEGEGVTQGIELLVRLEDVHRYADPDASDYTTRTASGEIALALSDVPAPTGVGVTGVEGGILIEWSNPTIPGIWDFVRVLANTANVFSGAVPIYEGRADKHLHKLDSGETYYYWVVAKKADKFSDFVPATATSTYTATAGNSLATAGTTANWSTVVDDGGKPDNNANYTTNTNELTDGAGLGTTANWSLVTDDGGKPDNNANYTTNTNELTDGAGLGTTANWSGVSDDDGNKPANNATANYGNLADLDYVTQAEIYADAVGNGEMRDNAITAIEIALDAVGASEIASGAVNASELGINAVTAIAIAANAVESSEIASLAVSIGDINIDAIYDFNIASDAVKQSEITVGGVASSEVDANAVGTSEISSGAVDTDELASGGVDTGNVAADAITESILVSEVAGTSVTVSSDPTNYQIVDIINVDPTGAKEIRFGVSGYLWTNQPSATYEVHCRIYNHTTSTVISDVIKVTVPENFTYVPFFIEAVDTSPNTGTNPNAYYLQLDPQETTPISSVVRYAGVMAARAFKD